SIFHRVGNAPALLHFLGLSATLGIVYEALRNRPICPRALNHSVPPARFILLTDRLKTGGRAVRPWVNSGYLRPNKFAQFLVLYLSHLKFHSNQSYEDTDYDACPKL